MTDDPIDTGELAEVPASERLKTDRGEGANALGDDGAGGEGPDDDLQDIYDDPGEVVEEALG